MPKIVGSSGRELIVLLTTGGTIEKSYDESDGSLSNRGTFIREHLTSRLRLPTTRIEAEAIMSKDSIFMTDADRRSILAAIKKTINRCCAPIIMLHGTDTLQETAQFCLREYPDVAVPVIFTGAMKPIGFVDSDAIQNVTEALAFAKVIDPGYYVSFHGQLIPADLARKNRERLTFEPTS